MLSLGWIDFSKSDRDIVLSVLRQLTEPGAVDELGVGTIRDGFSDILFPGTSTIQTRAKYLFIVPYICMELEREKRLSPRQFIEALEQRELELIDTLAVNGAEGVIGQRSRQTLKRKPSSIYWNALRTYGFTSEPVTLTEYAALYHSRKTATEQEKGLGKRIAKFEDDATDDADAGTNGLAFWRVPSVIDSWRKDLSLNLTAEEATYLRERIISMPRTRESLLSLVLSEYRLDFIEYETFDDIYAMQNVMPQEIFKAYTLASDFSRFIYGAQVRYNVIYSNGQNELANELWTLYKEDYPDVNLADVQARLKPHTSVMRFLKELKSTIKNETELDQVMSC